MANLDNYGLPISTTSDQAAENYRAGVTHLLAAWPGAAERLDAAIATDPDFALAHAARARLHADFAQPAKAKACIAEAERLVAQRGTERERSHVEVLSHALNNQPKQALSRALAHLDHWPRDTVILSLPLGAFGLFAFSGMADHDQARVDLCQRHADQYSADDWWFPTWALATLPISFFVVGMAACILPAGMIARRHGRRAAFLTGTGCGVLAGVLAAIAVLLASFWLFCLGTFFGGAYAASVLSFRFAAADCVAPERRARALSLVMAGGVFAGVIGPQLATRTNNLWLPHGFAATFIAQAAVAVLSALVGVRLSSCPVPPAPWNGP